MRRSSTATSTGTARATNVAGTARATNFAGAARAIGAAGLLVPLVIGGLPELLMCSLRTPLLGRCILNRTYCILIYTVTGFSDGKEYNYISC